VIEESRGKKKEDCGGQTISEMQNRKERNVDLGEHKMKVEGNGGPITNGRTLGGVVCERGRVTQWVIDVDRQRCPKGEKKKKKTKVKKLGCKVKYQQKKKHNSNGRVVRPGVL